MKKNALNILIFLLLLLIIGIVVYLNVHNKPKPVGSISLDKDVLNIYVGESVKINVLISSDTEGNNYLKWESDNNEIATVTDDGLVTGQGIGSTLVSVYSSNSGMRVKCLVKVKEIPVASNEPTPTITMMPTPTIKPTVVPTPTITVKPTVKPTLTPTVKPTLTPTIKPTVVPTPTITVKPTVKPTLTPTIKPTVTPTVKPTPIPIPEYIVKYYDTNEIKSETKKLNDTLGILPTVTKSGYTFLGWYTNSTGGNKVSSTTKVTANMTLYAHWEKAVVVLPDTFVAPSGYDEVIGKSYISDTLKYRTFKANSSNRYYSLIWVKNAYQQLNTANKDFNGGTRTDMLNYEIKAMSYQSKGMIATNGSFSYSKRSNTPAIISKGNLLVNDKYNRADNYYYSTVTLTKDGTFATYKTRNADELINWFTKVGARNSWNTTHFNDSDWNGGRSDGANHRTAICQIDKNNYVLYAGYSTGIQDYMKELHDVFGCKVVMNLDGGGSTGMYYKTMSMSNIGTVYEYHRSGESCPGSKCRTVGDMLYFVE